MFASLLIFGVWVSLLGTGTLSSVQAQSVSPDQIRETLTDVLVESNDPAIGTFQRVLDESLASQTDLDAQAFKNWVSQFGMDLDALPLTTQAAVYLALGQLSFPLGDDVATLEYFKTARAMLDSGIPWAEASLGLGDVYAATGNYPQAVESYTEGMIAVTSLPTGAVQVKLLAALGDVSRRMTEGDRALAYYKQAIAVQQMLGGELAELELGLAAVHRQMGNLEEATEVYLSGLSEVDLENQPQLAAMFYNNLGNVYRDRGQYTEALNYFNLALDIAEQLDLAYGQGINYVNQAVVHVLRENWTEALASYQQAEPILMSIDRPFEQRALFEGYAYVYEAMGDYPAALDALSQFNELNDLLISKEIQVAVNEIQARYETLLRDAELAQQAAELEIRQGQLMLAGLVIGVLFSVVAGLVGFVRFRNQKYQALYQRNKELMLAQRRNPFQLLAEGPDDAFGVDEDAVDEDATKRSKALYEQIHHAFEVNGLYKKADLTLDDVAKAVLSNRTYVSSAISTHAEMSFKTYVNFHRINEARRLLHQSKFAGSGQALAEAVGFTARSSFYRAFDQFVGMSPMRYAQAVQSEKTR